VNFTGHVNCVPPERIHLTEGIKLEAAGEVMAADSGLGLIQLSKGGNDRASAAMDRAMPGWRPGMARSMAAMARS